MLKEQATATGQHPAGASHLYRSATAGPDTVSPHDTDALEALAARWDKETRLPNLMRGAARSLDLAEVHKCVAREAIRAARSAMRLGDMRSYRHYLVDARQAHGKVRDCLRFARQCEYRVRTLILSGPVSRLQN